MASTKKRLEREREIARLTRAGKTIPEIAESMGVSVSTVNRARRGVSNKGRVVNPIESVSPVESVSPGVPKDCDALVAVVIKRMIARVMRLEAAATGSEVRLAETIKNPDAASHRAKDYATTVAILMDKIFLATREVQALEKTTTPTIIPRPSFTTSVVELRDITDDADDGDDADEAASS